MAALNKKYFEVRASLDKRGIKHLPSEAWALACAIMSRQ